MDRKFCVLLYSKHSQASLDVLNYIRNIPIDFPTITGMTMICIDNPEFKLMLHNNGIKHVPTLLVEYYNGSKQKFERDYIYMWIDQIITHKLSYEDPTASDLSDGTNQFSEQNVKEIGTRSNRTPIFPIAPPINASKPIASNFYARSASEGVVRAGGGEPQDPKTPDVTIPMSSNKKPDIAAIALEMQKNRDLELAEIKEYQKPI